MSVRRRGSVVMVVEQDSGLPESGPPPENYPCLRIATNQTGSRQTILEPTLELGVPEHRVWWTGLTSGETARHAGYVYSLINNPDNWQQYIIVGQETGSFVDGEDLVVGLGPNQNDYDPPNYTVRPVGEGGGNEEPADCDSGNGGEWWGDYRPRIQHYSYYDPTDSLTDEFWLETADDYTAYTNTAGQTVIGQTSKAVATFLRFESDSAHDRVLLRDFRINDPYGSFFLAGEWVALETGELFQLGTPLEYQEEPPRFGFDSGFDTGFA